MDLRDLEVRMDPWCEGAGRVLTPFEDASLYAPAAMAGLRSLQLTHFDPGSAAYRYHSAANHAGGGISAFARWEHEGRFCDLRQWDIGTERAFVLELMRTADVVHVHMDYACLDPVLAAWPTKDQLLIRHYHGSVQPEATQIPPTIVQNAHDDAVGAVQVGARLYHSRYSSRMHWLPIPMPIGDYARLRARHFVKEDGDRPLRIAHSPTQSAIKGTSSYQHVVTSMARDGKTVVGLKIAEMQHGDALAFKATADIFFDSFWLGIQGSGLEAAAMGQMVIAGDAEVRDEYIREIGYCPYTFAADADELRQVIERAIEEPAWRYAEAARVNGYVRQYHDYAVVGARYWEIVRTEMENRDLLARAA